VVLGDPGGGKTTMLRWLATAYLLRHTSDPTIEQLPDVQTLPAEPWIPVLIRCRDIGEADLCRSFKEVLAMHLNKTELQPQESQVMLAVILDRLARGEILLLVDGLDEISNRRVRQTFCQQLERTAVRYPDAPILVTSRIVGYRAMPDRMRTGFAHGVISDLHQDTKDLFASRWVEATEAHQNMADRKRSSQALIAALHSSDRIERLTGNPMLLTTMALVKRKVGKLPTRRNKLYAEAVSVLLNWNPNVYSAIEEEEALPQLAFLAYEMCRRGVQQLNGEEVLDLLDQLRDNYPKIRPLKKRNSQDFLHLLEERSGLLMRSGMQWQPNQSHEKAVWEFRHLTFQEYLAALALNNGHYKGRNASQSLAEQVMPLAKPVSRRESPDERSSGEDVEAVPDFWREALRLLVSICKDDDVDAVLLSILHPGPGEEAAKTQVPRAVLAAQCLADEPNVGEDTAQEVLRRFVALVGENDGLSSIQSNVEKVAQEIWSSHPDHRAALEACLLGAFMEPVSLLGRNCGAVLAQLLGSNKTITAEGLEEIVEMARGGLGSPDELEAIRAALQVLELAYQQWFCIGEGLEEPLLALLGRGGACARAAAWALAWLSVSRPSGHSERGSIFQNRLLPPVLATEWEGAGGGCWQPTEEQTRELLEALGHAKASEGEGKRHLLVLLGKSAQPSVVLPLLQYVADPDASVREASREALAWMANHLPAPLQPAQLDALEEQLGAGLVRNDSLADAERCDGLVVMALFGHERLLREVLADQGAPVALRRQAAEGLGLVAYRCGNAEQRQRLRDELEGLMRGHAFDLLVTGAEGWAEHDQCLPVLRGASRGLQMAASEDLPLLGVQPRQDLSMLTLTALQEDEGLRIRTEVVDRAVWRLPLPEGEHLELVVVQAGEYWIGSPEEEEGRDRYGLSREKGKNVNVEARRLVRLERFALARYPVTQAQWRAVASLMRLERDLNLIPSRYKQDDLWDRHAQPGVQPVESVSWNDCQEWLKRLNHWLKEQWPELGGLGEAPQLALPSESQWEVACRAGANTPFHFGDTLDATWANYDGNSKYGTGRTGIYRQRPVPVGFFGLVNYWGLAEMHGQLWEWCANQWCADPLVGSAVDESPLEGLDSTSESKKEVSSRLLRGGSWFFDPRDCRAACRVSFLPADTFTGVGFRPCCLLPPGSLLGS
jgi:formylglycine-generating enzyme required for sulfatase activity